MTKATVLPISIVPPVPWMAALINHAGAVIDPWEHYVHQSVRNRYHICTANGTLTLTIPVKSVQGLHTPTALVLIDYSKPWQRQHMRTLEAAYRKAPFWEHYEPHLKWALTGNDHTLGDLFHRTLPMWLRLLKCKAIPAIAKTYVDAPDALDLRKVVKNPTWWGSCTAPVAYTQVWAHKHGFTPYMSIADLLLNEGPEALRTLQAMAK